MHGKKDNKIDIGTHKILAAIAIDSESTRGARSSANFVTYFQQQQQKIYISIRRKRTW